jgi:hypothetical protein
MKPDGCSCGVIRLASTMSRQQYTKHNYIQGYAYFYYESFDKRLCWNRPIRQKLYSLRMGLVETEAVVICRLRLSDGRRKLWI